MKGPPVPRRLPDGWHRRLDPNGGQVYSCPAQQILVQRPLSDTWRVYCRGQQLPDKFPTAQAAIDFCMKPVETGQTN